MIESKDTKISKREFWQNQINQWQESHLSQSAFCERSGIKLSTFTYWRGLLLEEENKKAKKEFVPVKIVKDKVVNEPKLIQLKLLAGHIIYVPVELGINEIAKLIQLLGLTHA
jgi:hypothetical protein